MKIIPIVIISTFTTLAIIGSVYAKPHGSDKAIERITEKLTLNDAQQNHLKAFFDEKKALKQERKRKSEDKKTEGKKVQHQGPFTNILKKDTISIDDINQTLDEIHAKKREKQQNALIKLVTFVNSLSAEQRQKLQPILHRMLSRSTGQKNKKRKNKSHKHDS